MLNQYGKKLKKELNKVFTLEQQEEIAFYPDLETKELYIWKFDFDHRFYRWSLDKKTGKITKRSEANIFA